MSETASIIRLLLRKLGNFLAAVAITYLLASATATQAVIASLAGMGIDIGLATRSSMTLQDLAGMAGMLLPLIAFGLLFAFLFTALLCRWLARWRLPLYALAGATAVVAIHVALNLAFQITPVAIARSGAGLLVQALAGAAGGLAYALLSQRGQLNVHDTRF